MTRRRATILLHWLTFVLAMFLLAGDAPGAVAGWAFVVSAASMVGLALVFGLMSGPGPKLTGALRAAHPWMHRGMYALAAWTAIAVAAGLAGRGVPGPDARTLAVILLGAGMLHGVFHLWRHTALGDGALRRMLPRAVHGML